MPEPEFDVFLSHASPDKPVVEDLARILKRRGIEPWLDSWNLVPGEPWQEAIEEALGRCVACAVFIGPSGTGPWQNEEMRAAIERQVGRPGSCRVIPVLLPSAERGERSRLPAFLVRRTWVEFHDSLEDERVLHRLVAGIRGEPPGPAPGEAVAEGACPYRGLRFFDVEDSLFFHGREALTGWLLAKLRPSRRDQRFLAIVGPSGSGKSSLARAGLLAALKNGELPGSQIWPRVICKPGEHPLESLAIALTQALHPEDSAAEVSQLARSLAADSHTLHITARLALGDAPEGYLILLIDQFEEVFTLCTDEPQRQALIDNLIYAAREPAGQTAVVLTLRSDFFGRCAAYPDLAAFLSDRTELVGTLEEEDLRSAIEEPARLSGLGLEGGLADLLMAEVEGQKGGLPLLQHALLQIWERRDGRRLTVDAYQEIGGVAGALQSHAEQVFADFARSESEKETCRRVFLRLVQVDDQQRVTKRRISLDELVRGAEEEGDRKIVETVVSRFTEERLLTAGGDEERPTIELAHEALLTAWKRLAEWIQDEQQDLQFRDRLEEASREWVANGRDPSYLYSGVRLSQAEDWTTRHPGELNSDAEAFVQASVARNRRQRRWTMALLSTAVVVAVLVAFAMFRLWKESDQQLRINLATQIAGQAKLNLRSNPLISLLLGIEAVRLQNDLPLAKEALLDAVALTDGRPLGKPGIVAVALSADRRTLVTANKEGTVTLWDLEPEIPREVRTLHIKGTGIKGLAVSSDSRWLLSRDEDADVRLWDLRKKDQGILLPDENWRSSDPFSPDSRWLVTQRLDTPILRSLDSDPQMKELKGWPQIQRMAYGSDGRLQVLPEGRQVTDIETWDLSKAWNSANQAQESARSILPESDLKNRVVRIFLDRDDSTTFSSDGQWIGSFVRGSGNFLLQQKVTDKALIKTAFPAQEKVPDSAHIGTNFPALGQPLHSLFFVRGDRQIVTQAGTEAPRLRDLSHYHYRQVLAVKPEGTGLAVRESGKSLELVEGKGSIRKLHGDTSSWTGAFAFSPDRTRLAAGFREGKILLWNLTDGHLTPRVATLEGSLRGIRQLAFDPQGHLLAIGAGSAVWLWDIESGELKSVVRENTQRGVFLSVSDLAFGSNPPRLAMAWDDGKVLLFGLAGLRFLKDLSRPTEVTALAFSPDGKKLAIADFDSGKAHIWSNEGAEISLQNQDQQTRVLAFSKNGRWLAGSGFDGTVQLWDLGKERASGIPMVWKGHRGLILSLAFTGDGRELITTGATDSVRHWPLDPDEMIRVACARAGEGRSLTKEEWSRHAPPGASFREGAPCAGVGPPRSSSVF